MYLSRHSASIMAGSGNNLVSASQERPKRLLAEVRKTRLVSYKYLASATVALEPTASDGPDSSRRRDSAGEADVRRLQPIYQH